MSRGTGGIAQQTHAAHQAIADQEPPATAATRVSPTGAAHAAHQNACKRPNNRLRMSGCRRANWGYTGVSRFLTDCHAVMPVAA
ncbi:hypothetical protein BWU74_17540 [Paraburkholderia caledonica]|nr:hypothetical protein BWU74_17540 [Burkholderia sp. Bk]